MGEGGGQGAVWWIGNWRIIIIFFKTDPNLLSYSTSETKESKDLLTISQGCGSGFACSVVELFHFGPDHTSALLCSSSTVFTETDKFNFTFVYLSSLNMGLKLELEPEPPLFSLFRLQLKRAAPSPQHCPHGSAFICPSWFESESAFKMWIRIQDAPEYGSNTDADPSWPTLYKIGYDLPVLSGYHNNGLEIRIRLHWIRIQYRSGSNPQDCIK